MTVISDITVSSEDFILGQTMQAVPDSRIEIEQLVPSSGLALPYFWVEQANADAVERGRWLGRQQMVYGNELEFVTTGG